ncbi:MAG: glycosyltransferase [Sphingobium sp.]
MTPDLDRASPPAIEALTGAARPLWSVMVPTYNCARQAGEALASVVAQAPAVERMEIVVVDDASDDDIEAVVSRFGARVRLHRQPHNLGVPGNLTAAIRLSRGHLIHILHGDDVVEPGFYAAMERAFANEEAGAAFCRYRYIDAQGAETGVGPLEMDDMGQLPDALQRLAGEQRIMTPSICVRREVYERLGGFHPLLRCAEDWEMWVRIARHYPIIYIPEILARYRMQPVSNTGRNVREARDADYNRIAIDLIHRHLPAGIADRVTSRARRTYAYSALGNARMFARQRDVRASLAQFRAAFRLSRSPAVWFGGIGAFAEIVRALVFRKKPA